LNIKRFIILTPGANVMKLFVRNMGKHLLLSLNPIYY
jgi:hypothetical protein